MRRVTAFVVLVAPALAWLPVHFWVQEQVSLWEQSPVQLPLRTRLLLVADNNLVRYYPFAIITALVLMPLWAYAASLVERRNPTVACRALLGWTLLSAGFTGGLVALIVSDIRPVELLRCASALWWASAVCYAFALGAGYVVQGERWRLHSTRWRPFTLLSLGGVAPMVAGPAALLIPALVWQAAFRDGPSHRRGTTIRT